MGATEALAREIAAIVAAELNQRAPKKALYTVEEASVYLGCSAQQVRNLMNAGSLKAVRFDAKPRFTIGDLEKFVEASKE